jgi:hypothetical protein
MLLKTWPLVTLEALDNRGGLAKRLSSCLESPRLGVAPAN